MDEAHRTIAIRSRPMTLGRSGTGRPIVRRSNIVWSILCHAALIAGVSYGSGSATRSETVHVSWEQILQPELCLQVQETELPHEDVAEVEPPITPLQVQPQMEECPEVIPVETEPVESIDWLPLERGASYPRDVWLTRVVEGRSHPTSPPKVESAAVEQQPSAYVEAKPLVSKNLPPPYPETALRRGIEGTVVIDLSIAADGSVRDASVVRSSGSVLLDESARRQLATWRFEPARRDGVAVATRFQQPVIFRIHS